MQTARRHTTRADYYRIVDVHTRLLARDASGTMALRLKLSMATGPSVHRHKWRVSAVAISHRTRQMRLG